MTLEVPIAVVSLMWVVGVLTLQRIDGHIKDFTEALKYFLANQPQQGTDRTAIDKIQLETLMPMPTAGLIRFVKTLTASKGAKNKQATLKRVLIFYSATEKVKTFYQAFLILLTMFLPFIYLIDASKWGWVTQYSKHHLALLFIMLFLLATFLSEERIRKSSERNYPLEFAFSKESH